MNGARKGRFVLISRWHLDCAIEAAWQRVSAIRHWPQWWPNVSAVRVEDDTARTEPPVTPRVGSTAWIDWTTRLGYGLRLRVTTTRVLPPFELEGTAQGDLNGQGLWVLEPLSGDGVLVTYRWDVLLNRPWMRVTAPLLRPIFSWNHFDVMRSGAKAMAHSLGCRLLRYQDYRVSHGALSEPLHTLPWPDGLALPSSRKTQEMCSH